MSPTVPPISVITTSTSSVGEREDALLDLVGDVRDDLHRLAEVRARALLGEHRLVDRAGRGVRAPGERHVDEALVVTEVEVGLALVVGDEHLAVLEGVHRAGVDVDVRVELLHRDPQAPALEQPPERRRGEPLAEARCHTTGHEDVLGQPPNLRVRCRAELLICSPDAPDRARPATVAPAPDPPGDPGAIRFRRMSETVGAAEPALLERPCRRPEWPKSASRRPPRWRGWQVMAGLALLAIVVRLPSFLSSRHLVFDDGTYGVSVLDMRHGLLPYREVFSAQGPLHFPLLYLGDLLGPAHDRRTARHTDAGRHRGDDRGVGDRASARPAATAGLIAGVLVATSGSMIWTTSQVTGDGPAAGLVVCAVWAALVYRDDPATPARGRSPAS